jgi:hypothetical protein
MTVRALRNQLQRIREDLEKQSPSAQTSVEQCRDVAAFLSTAFERDDDMRQRCQPMIDRLRSVSGEVEAYRMLNEMHEAVERYRATGIVPT